VAVDIYHEGEQLAQRRADVRDQAKFASRAIKAEIPEVAREFLAQQPMAVIATADAEGRMWASLLTGEPGFLRADGPSTVIAVARPAPGDPLRDRLTAPVPLGMIAIEPARHRRMRMNGRSAPTEHGVRVALDQVYANCPKYIQKREAQWVAARPAAAVVSAALTDAQRALIGAADTFFIATADRDGNADASHRGGNPGFVRVVSPTVLRWPDYIGNAMFNTLGNLEVNAAAGLLFLDWDTGTTVQLSGTARTDWDTAAAASIPGAQRVVEFAITQAVEIPHASPLRWSAPSYSRFNPPVASFRAATLGT
jgi:predicted pyridoxine 5'-phosphate oxidase superfamily flavin-nucleotide-binding protein